MRTQRSLDELLEEINRICPPESDQERAERRERADKRKRRAKYLQGDCEAPRHF